MATPILCSGCGKKHDPMLGCAQARRMGVASDISPPAVATKKAEIPGANPGANRAELQRSTLGVAQRPGSVGSDQNAPKSAATPQRPKFITFKRNREAYNAYMREYRRKKKTQ